VVTDVVESPPSALQPTAARARFRAGLVATTAGWCDGYAQANLVAVPADWAYDMLLFAQRNPRACPLLDVSDPGSPSTVLAPGADLRTDLPGYRVYINGELSEEIGDASAVWRDDMVAFLIGCSFTFERGLVAAGVPVRHLEQGRNVPMYVTDRACRSAGRLSGPLVVSMRPIPSARVATAVAVTGRYPAVHGAPLWVGGGSGLGIGDLTKPDFGDAVEIRPGEVPVFWGCGVTPQAAFAASRPPLAIAHAPGHMFITDVADEVFAVS
jgi:uncharacterized protein YcsI (UPF0317 family)